MKTNTSRRSFPFLSLTVIALVINCHPVALAAAALDELCHAAVSTDPAAAEKAIRSLRERGPEGLQALLTTHAATIQKYTTAPAPIALFAPPPAAESWVRLRTALDAVSQQRDCFASHLFWYTDFAQAKLAARAQGKPILSLRLLGKLDEEFSCANSRFFRTTLYANAAVAQQLRENFILHWKSVRPVPRVTIDFGDGRKLERTLTGNSIHYVLNSDGEVVDALPGLYGAKAFLRGLDRAAEIARQSVAKSAPERQALLTTYHRSRVTDLHLELEQELQKVSGSSAELSRSRLVTPVLFTAAPPTATVAAGVATGKGRVELPMLNRTTPPPLAPQTDSAAIDDATWQKIAALHAEDAVLDSGAKALIKAKGPNAIEAGRLALSKSFVEDPLLRKMRAMERSISEDTVRNEYLLHRQIHEWLATASAPVEALNARVYAELFLTPDSDPWLGLLPDDAYAALENDGLSLTKR
jgi:hypothetical protein